MSIQYEASNNSSKLLNPSLLTAQQNKAIEYITQNNAGVIVADTGIGKTIISLTAIAQHQQKTIVAAPPKVIKGWPSEAAKWVHTKHLKLTLLNGNPEERAEALKAPADILLISLNSLDWLLKQKHGAQSIIIDELSKAAGKQTAALKTKRCDMLTKRIGLTATPVSEDFQKLFAMVRILDKGAALGTSKQRYLEQYFYPTDYKRYNWKMRQGCDKQIISLISHLICDVNTNKADTLPPLIQEEFEFLMPDNTRTLYDSLRKDLLLESSSGDVVAANLAVLSGKLRQLGSGFAITEEGDAIEYDTERAQTLVALLEEDNTPALILYEYNHQRDQICKVLDDTNKSFTAVYGGNKNDQGVNDFKAGKVRYLVAQKNTLSHGVNGLQFVCNHIIFYHPLWSNDNTLQAIGRIWRQGTPFNQVKATTLVCDKSLDDLVLTRLDTKAENMKIFLNHLRG